jgi:hypothetical protein
VKGRLPTEQPKVAARCLDLSSETLMGTNIDLAKLTLRPVDAANEFSKAFRIKSCLPQPSRMIRVSSAYCKIGKSEEYCKGIGRVNRPNQQQAQIKVGKVDLPALHLFCSE